MLAREGKKVSIVEALPKLMAVNGPLCSANREMLERLIPYNGVDVICGASAKGYADGALTVEHDGQTSEIACDSVILAVGYKSNAALYDEIRKGFPESYLLGDASRVSNIMYAIWDAFEVANHI